MAAFEGFTLLSNFASLFTFLFTFSIIYGVLSITKVFGDSGKTVNPIIAFSMAIFGAFSGMFTRIISTISPLLITVIVMIFFIILILRFLGVEEKTFSDFFVGSSQEKKTVIYWVIVLVIILITIVVSIEIGDEVGPYVGGEGTENVTAPVDEGDAPSGAGDSFAMNLGAAMFHPKVVGSFIILLFASLAIRQLSMD